MARTAREISVAFPGSPTATIVTTACAEGHYVEQLPMHDASSSKPLSQCSLRFSSTSALADERDGPVSELQVRDATSSIVLSKGESLGFGRTAATGSSPKGWGYDGRFLEIGAASHLHRIWGEILWRRDVWVVRSLGERDAIVVVAPGPVRVELPPRRVDSAPAEYAMADGSAILMLSAGGSNFSIGCSTLRRPDLPVVPGPTAGEKTTTLGQMLAGSIGRQEYRVLWVMAREYRDHRSAEPTPLSYARVVRALDLKTEKQAKAAIERLKARFRVACLLPAEVPPDRQRDWMCRFAVQHRLFEHLAERYGEPPVG